MFQPQFPLGTLDSETRHLRRCRLEPRFASGMIALMVLLVTNGCTREQPPKVEAGLVAVDLRIPRGHLERLPFELRSSAELRLEIVHLGGQPVSAILMNKKDLNDLDRDFRDVSRISLSFYTAMSQTAIDDRFDSGWQQFSGPAVYTILIWPRRESDAKKDLGTSLVRIRLLQRK
jgi:hypothetical protein